MFSIVIPLFNKEYSIKNCLSSVFSQEDCSEFEVVLVDDGSTDQSMSVVFSDFSSQIKSGQLRVIRQKNSGVSVARNVGAKYAQFDFLCFLDADDEWKPGFLSAISGLIEYCPDAVAYSTGHSVCKGDQVMVQKKTGYPDGFRGYVDNFFISSTKGSILNSSKVCIRKYAFEESGGFPESAVVGEDLFLWIHIAMCGKIAMTSESLVVVNQVSDTSRFKRRNKVPYPLEYYSKNIIPNFPGLNRYLFVIFYKHFASSLLGLRVREAFAILRVYLKLKM